MFSKEWYAARYPEDEREVEGLLGMLSRPYRATTRDSAKRSPLLNRLGTTFDVEILYLIVVFRIRIRIRSGFNQVSISVSGSGFGFGNRIQEVKMTHKKYSMFSFLSRAKGFFCSLNVIYGGLGIGKL
jgi:hypothetical protein